MKKLLVSIVITTKNEEEILGTLLKSIKNQTYSNTETILVDNYSTDNTLKVASKYKVAIYQFGPERSAQRNFGARKSRGKYLLFLDADMELASDVVKECVEVFDTGENIGGVVIPEQSIAGNLWENVKAFERSFYNLEGDNITDAARFFSRESFDSVGGFDENITGPEDWDLSENIQKKGYQIVRISSRIKHYERIKSLFSLMKKKYYYGLEVNQYLNKQQISSISPKTIYFLRPIFYKNWQRLVAHPFMTGVMFYMLLMELLAGGMGFIMGKFRND